MTLGFSLYDLGNAGRLGINVAGVNPEAERRQAQAYVNYVNKQGGINGRTIRAVYATFDATSQDSAQAACLQLTQDHKSFAVIGDLFPSGNGCVTRQNKTLMLAMTNNNPDEVYQQSEGRLFTMLPSGSRMMVMFAEGLARRELIRGKKIGIFNGAAFDPNGSAGTQLVRAVEAAGGQVVHNSRMSADLGVAASQIPVEVQKMRTAGAEVVLMIDNQANDTQFVSQAESQRYLPKYYVTDWGAMANDIGPANMTSSFDGALAITGVRTNESLAGLPEPPETKTCVQIYQQQTGEAMPERDRPSYGVILNKCVAVLLFADAARAAGGQLSQTTFRAGLASLDTFAPAHARFGGGRFTPSKPDYNDRTRVMQWSDASKRWKPISDFAP